MQLLERDDERAVLDAALEDSRTGGRVVLVAGEAGIGKTALVAAAVERRARRRVLWGVCDPLVTPRPMGPLWDVAHALGGPVLAAMERGAPREELLGTVLRELAGEAPSILVVEDLHWSDDATLDLLALLARRLVRARGCLVMTCRTDALAERPEVRRLLAALPPEGSERLEPAPLSERAIAVLAGQAGRDAAGLLALTGGNPFFVTEALAAPTGHAVPGSVRDAVAARVAALGQDARAVVELVAVVPGSAELWLLTQALGAGAAAIDACIDAGILVLHGDAVAFRHDLARRAVEDAMPPLRRRRLDGLVLRALEEAGGADPARLAHHARRACDEAAIRRLAPAAARTASAAGGHRQALEQWEAALATYEDTAPGSCANVPAGSGRGAMEGAVAPGSGAAAPARAGRDGTAAPAGPGRDGAGASAQRERPGCAEALEGVAVEAYLCGRPERAMAARRALLELHRAAGDLLRAGDDLRWLSRILWWTGRGPEAEARGDESIAILERFPHSRELALALSGRSQLAMLAERSDEAIVLGNRAVELGRRIGDRETVAHGLTNVGTAMIRTAEYEPGRAMLEEAFTLAVEAGHDDHAARALVNLATATLVRRRDHVRAAADLDRALAFARGRDLDGYAQYMLGMRANLRVLQGAWPAAEEDARASLALGEQPGVSLCPALLALGRLQARRGDAEAGETLDEAWRLAVASRELQRLAPAAAARAEHAWLEADLDACAAAAAAAYDLALDRGDQWARGELAFWLWRAGAVDAPPSGAAAPFVHSIGGDWRGAADAWAALGFPYETADALSEADDVSARLEGLAGLDALGAARAARRLRRRLREAGVRRIPRGPKPATRAGLAGLTPRQADVLALLEKGATNAEIAQRLVIAPKTVDHHVSAVLAKLGVSSRREAAAAAARLLGAAQDGGARAR